MRCVPLFLSLVLFYSMAAAQKVPPPAVPPPPPPMPRVIAKPTPVDQPSKTEEQIVADTLAVMEKPVEWKVRSMNGFNIAVIMPRGLVSHVETFSEPGLGRMTIYSHISFSDSAIYSVGRMVLPYTITDEKILRKLYNEFASGMAQESKVQFQHVADFTFEGKLGVEFRSLPPDARYQSIRARAFVFGRDVYFMTATPNDVFEDTDPPEASLVTERSAEFDRFFGSLKPVSVVTKPVVAELPIFAGTFADGKYFSEHFKFSFVPPNAWIKLSSEEVNDLQNWGRQTISEQSGRDIPDPARRRNLFTFTSAPMGSDGSAMISLNLGFPSNSFNDVKRLSDESARLIASLGNFKVIKAAHDSTVGEIKALSMVNELNIMGSVQHQYIYHFLTRGYVMSLTISCHAQADCTKAIDSLSTWQNEVVK